MIANEYANAIFGLAQESNCIINVREQFDVFFKACSLNKDFLTLLLTPNISKTQKKEAIKQVTPGFEDIFIDFLYVLVDNNRFELLNDIYHEFTILVLKNENTLLIDVYAPFKLDDNYRATIIKKMQVMYHCDKVIINDYVDEELIGGIKIVFNGQSLDLSLQDKLSKLQSSL